MKFIYLKLNNDNKLYEEMLEKIPIKNPKMIASLKEKARKYSKKNNS